MHPATTTINKATSETIWQTITLKAEIKMVSVIYFLAAGIYLMHRNIKDQNVTRLNSRMTIASLARRSSNPHVTVKNNLLTSWQKSYEVAENSDDQLMTFS